MKLALCVSGQGRLALEAVEHASRIGFEICLVLLDTKAAEDVADRCHARGIAFRRLRDGTREEVHTEIAEALESAAPDLVALTFDRLLQATLVERFRGRIINVHPSLLPAFSGSRGLERTVASGSRFAGATIHVVTSELDAGPIIAQCVLAKGADESSASVGGRLYLHLRPMFLQVLCWFAEGRVYFRPDGQVRVAGGSYETLPVSPAIERRFEE